MKFRLEKLSTPVADFDRPLNSAKPTEKQKAEWEAKAAEYDRAYDEWRAKQTITFKDEEFEPHALFAGLREVEELKRAGSAAALIKYDWVCNFEYWLCDSYGNQDTPMSGVDYNSSLTLPFSLGVGDDFVRIRFVSRKWKSSSFDGVQTTLEGRSEISGKLNGERFSGFYIHEHLTEMQHHIAALKTGSQELCDELARRMKPIVNADFPKDMAALLPPSDNCFHCNRPLNDTISKIIRLGSTCAKSIGVLHSKEAADYALKRRAEFWAEAVEGK